MPSLHIPFRRYLLHFGVFFTVVFISVIVGIVSSTPSKPWQRDTICGLGGTVSVILLFLFFLSFSPEPASVTQIEVRIETFFATTFSWMNQLYGLYDVNHRNTALLIIVTVPLLTILYFMLWWDQMQSYGIQTTTAPLVSPPQTSLIPLQ